MNYDLCDLLNRKMENTFSYMPENLSKPLFKNQNFIDDHLQKNFENQYIEILEKENFENDVYSFWVYRNGKISDQLSDFEIAAKKITREISNLTFSNFPSLDIMYFSGALKLIFSKNKCMYLETCTKPSLDQLMSLKDIEKKILKDNGKLFWRIIEKRYKNSFHDGIGLDSLFAFNWSRIK